MEFIVAVDANWGIGKDGGMLDHLPKDLAFFKKMTTGHVLVMGRKTLESFPGGRPLPNRVNIVLSRNQDYQAPAGAVVVHSVAELAATLRALGRDDVFLVGGASLYQTLLDGCSAGYVTHIGRTYEGAEAFFPNLETCANWQLEEILANDEDDGRPLRFCKYRNHTVKSLEDLSHE